MQGHFLDRARIIVKMAARTGLQPEGRWLKNAGSIMQDQVAVALKTTGSNERLFNLYVGDNAERFLAVYRTQQQGGIGIFLNWAVVLFGSVWFFYRKMYLAGIAYLLVPGFADALYVARARRLIAKAEREIADPALRESWIERQGGFSLAGLMIGIAVEIGWHLLPLYLR